MKKFLSILLATAVMMSVLFIVPASAAPAANTELGTYTSLPAVEDFNDDADGNGLYESMFWSNNKIAAEWVEGAGPDGSGAIKVTPLDTTNISDMGSYVHIDGLGDARSLASGKTLKMSFKLKVGQPLLGTNHKFSVYLIDSGNGYKYADKYFWRFDGTNTTDWQNVYMEIPINDSFTFGKFEFRLPYWTEVVSGVYKRGYFYIDDMVFDIVDEPVAEFTACDASGVTIKSKMRSRIYTNAELNAFKIVWVAYNERGKMLDYATVTPSTLGNNTYNAGTELTFATPAELDTTGASKVSVMYVRDMTTTFEPLANAVEYSVN